MVSRLKCAALTATSGERLGNAGAVLSMVAGLGHVMNAGNRQRQGLLALGMAIVAERKEKGMRKITKLALGLSAYYYGAATVLAQIGEAIQEPLNTLAQALNNGGM